MSVHALKHDHPALTPESLAERIHRYVEHNVVPFVAVERVIRDLCHEGRQDELLLLIGPSPLFDIYTEARQTRTSMQGTDTGAVGRQRRIDRNLLMQAGSLLESMVELDGHWRRLGDLDRRACLKGATIQKRAAYKIAQRSRFYHTVAQQLAEGEIVRDKLDDAALTSLFEAAGR